MINEVLLLNLKRLLLLNKVHDFEFYSGQPVYTHNNVQYILPVYHHDYGLFFILIINPYKDNFLFLEGPEVLIRLNTQTSLNTEFRNALQSNDYGYIVYHMFTYNLIYPEIGSIYQTGKINKDKLIISNLGLNAVQINNILPSKFEYKKLKFLTYKTKDFKDRDIYIYTLVVNDIWHVYQLVTLIPLENIDISKKVLLRIDSACIAGQIIGDLSCDCYNQLHKFLNKLEQYTNGIAILLPGHEGRGVGIVPKIETELYKMGISGKIYTISKPLSTIEAARLLYNTDDFDIRTYDGAVKILKILGINDVIIFTDNKIKYNTLLKYKIKVTRDRTETKSKYCQIHINAKHNYEKYYFRD